jgi:hypothetical protein
LDGVDGALLLVGAEVVEDHDVARTQLRDEDMEDVLVEDFAVGGRVDGHAGGPAVAEEGPDEGPHAPMAVGSGVAGALSAQGPAVEADHLGRRGGFVDEDEARQEPFRAFRGPALPLGLDFGAVLFGGAKRFFLCVMCILRSVRKMLVNEQARAKAVLISARVAPGFRARCSRMAFCCSGVTLCLRPAR